MKTTRCDYCHHHVESQLVKEVNPPIWENGGMACHWCRNAREEADAVYDQDRVDAERWRALRPLLMVTFDLDAATTSGRMPRWLEVKCTPFLSGESVDAIVDKLVRIAEEKGP